MIKFFTIDSDNCLSAETDQLPPSAAREGDVYFATQEELANLTEALPVSRLVEVWNSFAGAPPFEDLKEVRRFTDRKTAVSRIWHAAERLGAQVEKDEAVIASKPAPAAKPKKAKAAPTVAKGAPANAKPTKDATAKPARDGSKTAQVVAMLQRKNGATLAEIMEKMGWQRHTVRGFMAGAMKKAGYTVESFKPEGGDRTYRINA